VDEALAAREAGERRVILFLLSGHGHFDMGAYDAYFSGQLEDYEYPEAAIREALTHLPPVPAGA
jgi:tryptophan synthase beta chain